MLKRTREMMARQVNHMVHLIDDLMDVARISSGKMELKRELVTLDGIVSSAIEASAPHLEASSHTLSVSLPDPAIVLFADHVRIAQVLGNLLTNAGKYTPKGGDISLSAQCVGETLTIAINDNGMGIPKEALGSVFDMFTQVNRMLGHANGGLGIGLSIVKQLVELHGGSVGVSSDGPNLGSTFIITLPLATRAQSPENLTRDGRLEQATTMRTLKILVADDNFDAASSLADLLLLRGHDVILANDGKEALVKACEAVPDIIFLDIGMPGLTGLEVARAIRRSPAYEQMILVALTGWGTELDRERTRQAGCNHHFTKPIDLEAVDQLLLTIAQN
jgi:CheY-like chemotaxis protein